MKKTNLYILTAVLVSTGLSSCQKKFDPSTYAPPLDINGYTAANEVAKESLIAYWGFDGSLVDSVSNTAGTATGTTFAEGTKGDALQGALNSYVIAAPSTAVANLKSFTITEWINTPPPSVGIIPIFSLAHKTGFWGNIEFLFVNGCTNDHGGLSCNVFYGPVDQALD
jgi:hypothetical protein